MAGKKAGFLCITPAVQQGINSLADFGVKLPYIGTAMSHIFSNRKLLISSKSTN
jgi:hypothetical protein